MCWSLAAMKVTHISFVARFFFVFFLGGGGFVGGFKCTNLYVHACESKLLNKN